jgi:hypothetical protein
MNQIAKQLRDFCQDRLVELQNNKLDEEQTLKNIIIMLDQMHKRLTLLEGEDIRKLDRTTF